MNYHDLKKELHKQEMLLRSYLGYSETNIEFSQIQGEIARLLTLQKEIDEMTTTQILSEVPVHYEVIESNFAT